MSETPIWFGDPERPLFGWLHLPDDGRARAGVVLVPTLAVEAMSARPAERQLARRLAASGVAVLRYDYPGTGDSDGEFAEVVGESFVRSAEDAIAYLRRFGCPGIGVVGLRFGALVAASVCAADPNVDALVLWAPTPSGRAFFREQRALKHLSIGETPPLADDDAFEILGMVLSDTQHAELSRLNLSGLPRPFATSVLAALRADRATDVGLDASVASDHYRAEVVDDIAGLVDVLPDDAVLPGDSLELIQDYLLGALPTRFEILDVPRWSPGVELKLASGGTISERPILLGDGRLFGIVTEPANPVTETTVIFLNAGLLHHVGPARLWVDIARRIAAEGMRSVRFDLSGLGDSGERPGQQRQISYPLEALDDIAAIARFVAPPDGRDVVYVGLCAGAYHSIEAGIALGARGACPINPILNFEPPEMRAGGDKDPSRQAAQPYNRLFRLLQKNPRILRFGERYVPPVVWWILDRTNVQPSPARGLQSLANAGTDILLICGSVEARPFLQRARSATRRLQAKQQLRFELLGDADHPLFGADARFRARDLLVEHLLGRFAADGVSPRPAPAPAPT